MPAKPPLGLVLGIQAVSVIGDILGQRASRVEFGKSTRKMLIVLTTVSSLQVLFVLGFLQIVLPTDITGAIYKGPDIQPCWREVDEQGRLPDYCDNHICEQIPCPAQGPWSLPKSIILHPLTLLNEIMDVAYYIGEVLLYHHPLGLVLIVLAAMVSSTIMVPFEALFGIVENPAGVGVLIVGMIGCLLCVFERPAQGKSSPMETHTIQYDDDDETTTDRAPLMTGTERAPVWQRIAKAGKEFLVVGCPFALLSATYCGWFVTQVVFNDKYRMNVFGYTSLDQILAPVFMFAFLLLVEYVPPLRNVFLSQSEQGQTLKQAFKEAWNECLVNKGRPLLVVFMYRLLINTRAMGYFYLSVIYDLQRAFLELQFTRVILSWFASLFVCLFLASFIRVTADERATLLSPLNMTLKAVGTLVVCVAIYLLNADS